MRYQLMHNYYDALEFHDLYKRMLGYSGIEWTDYSSIIPQIRQFLETEFIEYQDQYIEFGKWTITKDSYKSEAKNFFSTKNAEKYNDTQSWAFNFGQYLDKKYSGDETNQIYAFIKYIDSSFDVIMRNNYGINDDYSCKYELCSNFENVVRERFFEKGNRWIRKCEIIEKLFKDIRFEYFVFNPNIKLDFNERDIDKSSDQLLFVNRKHFTICSVYFENYSRIDFDVPKNVEHVESGESEDGYWSAIKVFRIDEKIKVYMPKTEYNNKILNSIY